MDKNMYRRVFTKGAKVEKRGKQKTLEHFPQ